MIHKLRFCSIVLCQAGRRSSSGAAVPQQPREGANKSEATQRIGSRERLGEDGGLHLVWWLGSPGEEDAKPKYV